MLKKLAPPSASCRSARWQRKSRRCLLFGKQLCIHDSLRHLIGLAHYGPSRTERQPETQMGWPAARLEGHAGSRPVASLDQQIQCPVTQEHSERTR